MSAQETGTTIPVDLSRALSHVLAVRAHARWWKTPIPEFDGQTPAAVWQHDPKRVRDLVQSYRSEAFS